MGFSATSCRAETAVQVSSKVWPVRVFGSVMKLQTLGDASRFGWLEGVVQRTELVSVEIVQHQPYHLGIRVSLIYQPPHLMSEVHSSATLGHLQRSDSLLTVRL